MHRSMDQERAQSFKRTVSASHRIVCRYLPTVQLQPLTLAQPVQDSYEKARRRLVKFCKGKGLESTRGQCAEKYYRRNMLNLGLHQPLHLQSQEDLQCRPQQAGSTQDSDVSDDGVVPQKMFENIKRAYQELKNKNKKISAENEDLKQRYKDLEMQNTKTTKERDGFRAAIEAINRNTARVLGGHPIAQSESQIMADAVCPGPPPCSDGKIHIGAGVERFRLLQRPGRGCVGI
ncbi:uncharacterized protein LOC134099808 [Sardina pilchardus]|uniref:uncharacterized protein LOC134099808 n=1 Tax=Sardina pilchardus TaxID=27697 RepID=UPI002E0F885F